MEDREILDLLFDRSQQGIDELQKKYGEKLRRLAENLLQNSWDAEECVNDACLAAWNSIPPARPEPLLPWLYKTVRNLAINRFHRSTAQKRGGFTFDAAFDELENMLVSDRRPEDALEAKELAKLLERFLGKLSPRDRALFLGRYWFGEACDTLAMRLNITENNCAVRLSRIRKKLRAYLIKKGAL